MEITAQQFKVIEHLPPTPRGNVKMPNLQVLNAVLYVAEHGCKWRGLPKKFGRWHSIYMRANRWAKQGDSVYKEKELNVAGNLLGFCPKDKADLVEISGDNELSKYTEEEIKIVGAIRSSNEEDELLARHVADDVGCYVQKVAKFGEKLEREDIIKRKMKDRYIYFGNG